MERLKSEDIRISIFLTIVVIIIVSYSGPVVAVITGINITNTSTLQTFNSNDNNTTFTAYIDIEYAEERIPFKNITFLIKYNSTGQVFDNCTFDLSGVNLTPCTNIISITSRVNINSSYGNSDSWGYGYGTNGTFTGTTNTSFGAYQNFTNTTENVALNTTGATCNASTELNASFNCSFAIDGNLSEESEWASNETIPGAWINVSLSQYYWVYLVILRDRENLTINISDSHLEFSDGTNITVGELPANGSNESKNISFAPKYVNSVKFVVDNGTSRYVGLKEIEIYKSDNQTTSIPGFGYSTSETYSIELMYDIVWDIEGSEIQNGNYRADVEALAQNNAISFKYMPTSFTSFIIDRVVAIPENKAATVGVTTSIIAWNTIEKTNITILYGTSPSALTSSITNTTFAKNHSQTLTGLSASTVYYYNITLCDQNYNCNTTGTYNFTTSAASDGGGGGSSGSSGAAAVTSTEKKEEKSEKTDGKTEKKEEKAEEKKKKVCDPKAKRCVSDVLQECNKDGTKWDQLKKCKYDCNPKTLTCNTLLSPVGAFFGRSGYEASSLILISTLLSLIILLAALKTGFGASVLLPQMMVIGHKTAFISKLVKKILMKILSR